MSSIAANYNMQPILNMLTPSAKAAATSKAASTTSSGSGTATSTTSSTSADGGVGTTFLNLLVQELQNQDPTNPVDSTAMVGQMISLNQLDQLISINQTLGGTSTSITGGVKAPTVAGANASVADPASSAMAPSGANALPFDPTTMMPVNSTFNPTAAAAFMSAAGSNPLNVPLNAQSMGLSAASNSASGGK